jgi:hypothetical protein
MDRTAAGKRLMLSDRDFLMFATLARYRYLRSTYLHAFAGGASETRFKERLGDLFHEGFLDRPGQQWRFADARCRPVVHALGRRALAVLRERESRGAPAVPALTRKPVRSQFTHTLMVSECAASVELSVARQPELRFIAAAEILARAPEAMRNSSMPLLLPGPGGTGIIPDGLFGLEYKLPGSAAYRFFALEVDRATMPVNRSDARQTSYAAKLRAYRHVLIGQAYKSHWGISRLLVLTVTTSEARMRSMMHALKEGGDVSGAFLFKVVRAENMFKPCAALLAEPWERVGHGPVGIGTVG